MANEQKKVTANGAKTAPFNLDDVKKQAALAGERNEQKGVGRKIGARTLKRRVSALCTSRLMLLLCLFMSVSALLTAFRGYYMPFTLYLTLQRAANAAVLWTVYITAGKKGTRELAWYPVVEAIVSAVGLLFLAAFTICAMFKTALIFSGSKSFILSIYKSGMWALVLAMSFVMAAYCIYLFKRRERLLLCNLRDALRYGFAFNSGCKVFSVCCIVVACMMPLSLVVLAVLGGFDALPYISADAAALFNRIYNTGSYFVLTLLGVLVHSVALLLTAVMTVRYEGVVKRYKEQRDAQKKAEEEIKKSREEAEAVEEEIKIARFERAEAAEKEKTE